jgi:acetyl-CoA C-acetyltransferase
MEALENLRPPCCARPAGFDSVALRQYPQLQTIEHLHTAGTSSGIVDGAALALVGSRPARASACSRARIVAAAVTGSEPTMLTGPAPAARKALPKAGLSVNDIDLFEVNEACLGGAALHERAGGAEGQGQRQRRRDRAGPPLGATGCLLGTLLDVEARSLRRGMVAMCVGGGMGIATIIERAEHDYHAAERRQR